MPELDSNILQHNLMLADQQQQRRLIHHKKKSRITLEDDPSAKHGAVNFTATQKAYFATGQGRRSYQEDRYQLGMITIADKKTTVENVTDALYQCIINLGKACEHIETGSTLAAFVIYRQHLITAHVGDSSIFLMTKTEPYFHCRRLTWDHKPYDKSEHQRIVKSGGQVLMFDTWRVNGVLAVSRALGDAGIGPGLIYEPSMTCTELSPDKTQYVLACTDGVTDYIDEMDMIEIFNKENHIEKIANRLRQDAYQFGSGDNMTILAVPVPQQSKQPFAIIGVVADGHGSSEVSEYIKEHLIKTYLESLQSQ